MKTFFRVLAYSVIVTSILSILLGFITIVSIWRINDPLIRGLSNAASFAETSLQYASNGLEKVDSLLSLLGQSMSDIQKNGEDLKAKIEEADPILDTLSLLIGEDARPKVEQALETLGAVRGTLEAINSTVQAINALPFIEIPTITQQLQQINDVLGEIDSTIQQMEDLVNQLKEGISTAVIQPIQDQAEIVSADLNAAQTDLQRVKQQVDFAYDVVVTVSPRISQIITGISILLTLQLLWSIMTQGAAIYLAWFYLKVGRLDLHRMVPAAAPEIDQGSNEDLPLPESEVEEPPSASE